jgi:DNA modification methylase
MELLMSNKKKLTKLEKNQINYVPILLNGDSKNIIKMIPDKSIKLIYGSPPYPNAKRNYKTWKIEDYIKEISPLLRHSIPKLKDDGFIIINIKANRTKATQNGSSERSLIVEELMLYMKKILGMYCVDIEIWVKSNPVPTGLRVACQDAYEYNLWFSKAKKWQINIDALRRGYSKSSLNTYKNNVFKRRTNGLLYVSRDKIILPHKLGALPINVVSGAVSGKKIAHQAVQPEYLAEKYINACTKEGDLVLDPWLGSGTTGVVAINHNRKFIGIEISKDFLKLAQKRIENTSYVKE